MSDPKQQLSELINLAQHFLQQEPRQRTMTVSGESYSFFESMLNEEPLSATSVPKEVVRNGASGPSLSKLHPTQHPVVETKQKEVATKQLASPQMATHPAAPIQVKNPETSHVVPAKSIQGFQIEPLKESSPLDVKEFASIIKAQAPNYPIRDDVPDDAVAKVIKDQWKTRHQMPAVVILSFDEKEEAFELLKNITEAITARLAPARVLPGFRIDKENKWEPLLNSPELRLIIANGQSVKSIPGLMKFCEEIAGESLTKIHRTTFISIDAGHCIKDPQQKRILWQSICNALKI